MFPYAADRWQAKNDLITWLDQGNIVVSNRYTSSNAYQAAKLPENERDRFTKWSFEMEYQGFGIPREDLVIFLYVPYRVSQKLIEQKKARKYFGNKNSEYKTANKTTPANNFIHKGYLCAGKAFGSGKFCSSILFKLIK